MIAGRRLSEIREFTIAPVKVTSIQNNAANGSTVTNQQTLCQPFHLFVAQAIALPSDPFGGRMNHNIGAMFDRFDDIAASTKGTNIKAHT